MPLSISTATAPAADLPRADRTADLRPVMLWLFGCCAMIFAMVVIGGITRLTWSGLSITEWQPVTGALPPLSDAAWAAEFGKYRQIPQYRLINAGMSLADFRTIYLWEYVHRLWGRLIGVAYLLPFLYFLVRCRLPRHLWPSLAGIFLLGGAQGALGWYMVESGLVDRVEVSQYRLVAHLVMALVIYTATLWIALGLWRGRVLSAHPTRSPRASLAGGQGFDGAAQIDPLPRNRGRLAVGACWRRTTEALIALVALTIAAGGFVAGLNAGLAYNTFPLMDGSLVPAGYGQLHPFLRNWFENVAAAQFDHRVLAMTTVGAVLAIWLTGWRSPLPAAVRLALHVLVAAAACQFVLGVSTLLLVVPVPLAAAHQAGAVILLTAAIVLRHTMRGGIGTR